MGGGESVVKGSLFPRCFPHYFKIENIGFILSTHSRINGNFIKEIDMNSVIDEKRVAVHETFHIIKNTIYIKGYEEYPLVLASIKHANISDQILQLAQQHIDSYIEYVLNALQKHKQFAFNEESLIQALNTKKDIAKKLAHKINDELFYIKKDGLYTVDDFGSTMRFLADFGL